jgi:hypothetical protein
MRRTTTAESALVLVILMRVSSISGAVALEAYRLKISTEPAFWSLSAESFGIGAPGGDCARAVALITGSASRKHIVGMAAFNPSLIRNIV